MTRTITADELVNDLARRLPKDGGYITAKQCDYALNLWRRENPTVPTGYIQAQGHLSGPDGEFGGTWELRRTPTGAGSLHLSWWSPADAAAAEAKVRREARLRDWNDRMIAAMDAGDREAMEALKEERVESWAVAS